MVSCRAVLRGSISQEEQDPMMTTTHQLGCRPGRARLGALGDLNLAPTHVDGNQAGPWHPAALCPAAPATIAMGNVGTTGFGAGFGTMERTARQLGTRST